MCVDDDSNVPSQLQMAGLHLTFQSGDGFEDHLNVRLRGGSLVSLHDDNRLPEDYSAVTDSGLTM